MSPFAGTLAILDASLAFLVRVEPGVVVWLRVILCAAIVCVWLGSDMTSPVEEGFRACAIANGPAHFGRKGTAILASTKLARTVTGSTFSLIFSCLTGSANPKTMCCTLLYILLHVLNASDCGFADRSWRYVWKNQKVYYAVSDPETNIVYRTVIPATRRSPIPRRGPV